MADSVTNLELISTSEHQPAVRANELLDATSPASLFGRRAPASVGLTWGYYGGKYSIAGTPTSIANGTVTLTNNATNYVRVAQATGVVSVVTSAPSGWPGPVTGYDALYQVVTSGGFVTSYTDWRANSGGGGSAGAQGAQGAQGSAGSAGSQGAQGAAGAQGAQGATGTGAQGSQGSQGSQGFQGLTGTGAQGAQGAQGSQGNQGTQGNQGGSGGAGGPFATTGADSFFGKRLLLWEAMDGLTTVHEFGSVSSANSTNSSENVSSTSLFTSTVRVTQATAATAGASNGFRSFGSGAPILWRGNASGLGGFTISFVFGVKTPVANMRMFCGLRAIQTAIGNVEPSSMVDIFGMGCDAGEANFSIIHNDASGTATKDALGSSFPVQTTATDVYRLTLNCAANGSSITYLVERLNTGDTATASVSTDLPTNSTFLNWQMWINNGATASAAASMLSRVTAVYGA